MGGKEQNSWNGQSGHKGMNYREFSMSFESGGFKALPSRARGSANQRPSRPLGFDYAETGALFAVDSRGRPAHVFPALTCTRLAPARLTSPAAVPSIAPGIAIGLFAATATPLLRPSRH